MRFPAGLRELSQRGFEKCHSERSEESGVAGGDLSPDSSVATLLQNDILSILCWLGPI